MSDKKKVGIIGLGAMGSRMAQNLITAGYPVVVYNRSLGPVVKLVEQGATHAGSPAEAAQQAEILVSMVTNDEASEAVWLAENHGAFYGLEKETIAISSSTLTPGWSKKLALKLKEKDVSFLEAPVVGTRPQATNGELVYLVAGEEYILKDVQDVFDVLGTKTVYMGGDVGSAMMMKLVINALLGIQAAALGEIVATIRRCMDKPDKAMDLLKGLPVMSPIMNRLMGKMEPGNYEPNFPIELVEKDLGYFVSAFSGGISYVEKTRQMYLSAIQEGYGQDDITGIIQLFEEN